jgi:uncharacterized protein (TIGR02145 family)
MTIKSISPTLFACLLFCGLGTALTACSSDDDVPAKTPAERKGTFTDPRDGQQYGYVTYAGLDWMSENGRYDIGDNVNSSIYLDADGSGFTANANEGSKRNLQRYGRLYTLSGAKAACPEGWRLPTDEDWQRLEMALGMSAGDAASDGWRGNIAQSMLSVYDDHSDLNLLLGGYYFLHVGYAGSWRFMGTYGYYWTDTPDTTKGGEYYYVRKLTYANSAVCRMSMEPTSYKLSVRYVRNAQ